MTLARRALAAALRKTSVRALEAVVIYRNTIAMVLPRRAIIFLFALMVVQTELVQTPERLAALIPIAEPVHSPALCSAKEIISIKIT